MDVYYFSTTIPEILVAFYHLHRGAQASLLARREAAIIPIQIYPNAEADKAKILSENTNKSGIYMWKNLVNEKRYIGSELRSII